MPRCFAISSMQVVELSFFFPLGMALHPGLCVHIWIDSQNSGAEEW